VIQHPEQTVLLEKLTAIEQALQGMTTLLETMTDLLERTVPQTPTEDDGSSVPIATYEQMYGPVESVPTPVWTQAPRPVPASRWRRWFVKET
jgi:hypothetical protein